MPGSHYTLLEHRHNFAAWAAARAAQRGFASVERLIAALAESGLPDLVAHRDDWPSTPAQFDAVHRRCGLSIGCTLRDAGIDSPTYGRAAKLMAVYLKTMVVLGPDGDSRFAALIHPPIDRILLRNLAADRSQPAGLRALCRSVAWTKLDETGYFDLIQALRANQLDQPAFWMLERYWSASDS